MQHSNIHSRKQKKKMQWIILSVVILFLTMIWIRRKETRTSSKQYKTLNDHEFITQFWEYGKLKKLIKDSSLDLPLVIVDLDVFDKNVKTLVDIAKSKNKALRIATKSIRNLDLIKRITELSKGVVTSYMCFSMHEAEFLAENGLNDFFVPYPTLQKGDVLKGLNMSLSGHKVTLTIDSVQHVEILDRMCSEFWGEHHMISPLQLRIAIDLDLSFKLFGGLISLGVHRSCIGNIDHFHQVAKAVAASKHLKLLGVIGYEAHVAGLPDTNPFSAIPHTIVRNLKKLFYSNAKNFRLQVSNYCKKHGIELEFFNGGGSGNLRDVVNDPSVTEVTAGSAFLQAQLFDYYSANECEPAMVLALQATRITPEYICCQSGGFVASGSCSPDKFLTPYGNPLLLQPYSDEGYGEVQTPLKITGKMDQIQGKIQSGDPVFFRPAKSGEIGEHFNHYILKHNWELSGTAKTYRGCGYAFY